MDDEQFIEKFRKDVKTISKKEGAGRLPSEPPKKPGHDADPFAKFEPKAKPVDPIFYKDRDNPRIQKLKKGE